MLSATISREQYRALRADPAAWRGAIEAICVRHGIVAGTSRPLGGSNLVAAIGDVVVKLFPPFLRYQWAHERIALGVLRGALADVATPALLHDGELDGWRYLIMTALGGTPLEAVWPRATHDEQLDLLAQIGALIRRVHAIDPGPIAALPPRWDDFIDTQRAHCQARHARLGLPAHLLAGLDAYLDRTASLVPREGAFREVILTGEYTPENLLVARRGARWRITGLIDFGDLAHGPSAYDLLGPATFLACGDPARWRALLGDRPPPARALLMALLLLHRHSDLGVQIRIDGWRDRVRTLDELAALIFPG
jgi:hygromycin-B 7''-O-kinase